MGIANWNEPFYLTSTVYTDDPEPNTEAPNPLPINQTFTLRGGERVRYLLRGDACSLTNTVRETKDNIPQADGAILHRRWLAGMEMQLTIQMWDGDKIACDEVLQKMLDTLNGYLYGLLNAGDNEGRIAWLPYSGANIRMLDDIRLLSYPTDSQVPGAPFETVVTLDTQYPYAADLTQVAVSLPAGTHTVTNLGNRTTWPVFQIYGPYDFFSINNNTTGIALEYDSTQPGAFAITNGHYIEIDTFRNTLYKDGTGANAKPGVVMEDSDFPLLVPGDNEIQMIYSGGGAGNASSQVLVNAAWT